MMRFTGRSCPKPPAGQCFRLSKKSWLACEKRDVAEPVRAARPGSASSHVRLFSSRRPIRCCPKAHYCPRARCYPRVHSNPRARSIPTTHCCPTPRPSPRGRCCPTRLRSQLRWLTPLMCRLRTGKLPKPECRTMWKICSIPPKDLPSWSLRRWSN